MAPAGFSEQDRVLWLKVATQTLEGVPEDLLRRGIVHARLTVDHPSKIVPAIMNEIGLAWRLRKRADVEARAVPAEPDRIAVPEPDDGVRMTADEILALTPALRSMALGKGWLTEAELEAATADCISEGDKR